MHEIIRFCHHFLINKLQTLKNQQLLRDPNNHSRNYQKNMRKIKKLLASSQADNFNEIMTNFKRTITRFLAFLSLPHMIQTRERKIIKQNLLVIK